MRKALALAKLREFEGQLDSIYHHAILSKISHDELMAEMQRFWSDYARAELPNWCASCLLTRREIRKTEIWRHHVRWGFMASNGQIKDYSSLSDSDRLKIDNGEIIGRHYWLHSSETKSRSLDGTSETITTTKTLTHCVF